MHDIYAVQILNSLSSLCEEEPCFCLAKHLFAVLIKEQIAVLSILEYHVNGAVFAHRIPQRNAMRIDEFGMDPNFSFDKFELSL